MIKIFTDKTLEDKFDQMISKIPVFLRDIAREKVSKKIVTIVTRESRTQATEKDLVDAFFAETPFGFHGPLKADMESLGIDYTKYGYDK